MSGWRARTAIDEAACAWASGRWLTALLTLAATVSVALASAIDIAAVDRLVLQERAWLDQGGRVVVLTAQSGGDLDAARCEALNDVAGVEWALALTRRRSLAATTANPDAAFSVTMVSAGYLRFSRLRTPGVVVGRDVAAQLPQGWVVLVDRMPHSDVGDSSADAPLPEGPLPVSGRSDLAALGPEYGFGVLLPSPAVGKAQTCIARLGADSFEPLRSALPALVATSADTPVLVADRLARSAFVVDPVRDYHLRGSAVLAYLTSLLCGLLWAVVTWLRRGQDALYAALGASLGIRALMHATQAGLVFGSATLLGSALALLYAASTGVTLAIAAPLVLRCAGIVMAIVLGCVALAFAATAFVSPLAALKDR